MRIPTDSLKEQVQDYMQEAPRPYAERGIVLGGSGNGEAIAANNAQ